MGYKDPEKQKAFQNNWVKKRRSAWIAENGPCSKCKSTDNLRVVQLKGRLESVKVWSYSDEYRALRLQNCTVMCHECMRTHYADLYHVRTSGKLNNTKVAKLTTEMVWSIRGRLLGRESIRKIAEDFGVTHHQVIAIQTGKSWFFLKGGRRKVWGIERVDDPPKVRADKRRKFLNEEKILEENNENRNQ